MPEDNVNWEVVAKNFQIENEVLRSQIDDRFYTRKKSVDISSFSVVIKDLVSFIERHPFVVMTMFYIVSTVIVDSVDVYTKLKGSK